MNPKKVVSQIHKQLRSKASKKQAEEVSNYFTEPIKPFGVSNPECKKIMKKIWKENHEASVDEWLEVCEELYKSGWFESAIIAGYLTQKLEKKLERKHFKKIESFIHNYVDNWASCDGLCPHSVGFLITKFPELEKELLHWSKSKRRRWNVNRYARTIFGGLV